MNDISDSSELSPTLDQEQKLLALIEDLKLFSSQYRTASRFNIFEAIGLHRQEIKHSNFLAFLLAPTERHGLHDAFLKRLVSKVFENLPAPAPIRPLKLALASFDDAVISREWRLDLIYRYGEVNAFEAAANSFFKERPELKSSVLTAVRAAFLPVSLIKIVPEFQGLSWFGQSRPITFFFHLSADNRLGFVTEVGPLVSEEFPREKLARKLLDYFRSNAKIYPKYTRFYAKYIKLPPEQANDADMTCSAMGKFYDDVTKDHLSSICDLAADYFKRPSAISDVAPGAENWQRNISSSRQHTLTSRSEFPNP